MICEIKGIFPDPPTGRIGFCDSRIKRIRYVHKKIVTKVKWKQAVY